MSIASLAARAGLDDPTVSAIQMQVRTGTSVPFSPYMAETAPSVDPIQMQVRTGTSVPFAPYMAAAEAPTAEPIQMQVRTGTSVPFASYMNGDKKSVKPTSKRK